MFKGTFKYSWTRESGGQKPSLKLPFISVSVYISKEKKIKAIRVLKAKTEKHEDKSLEKKNM